MILSTLDFIGKYAIPAENPFLQTGSDFLEKIEKKYCKKLLGYEAFREFSNNTTEEKWEKIINGFEYQKNNTIYEIVGMREMLRGFAYFEIMTEMYSLPTSSGLITQKYENAEKQAKFEWQKKVYDAYNQALSIYNNLVIYFYENNTIITRIVDNITDNADDTYTLAMTDTSDILCFSRLKMSNGNTYDVKSVTENSSIIINAPTGILFQKKIEFLKYNNITSMDIRYKKMVNFG